MRIKQHILVIAFSGRIGDTLLMTPAIRAIAAHFPEHDIHVLAHKRTYNIFLGIPFIHKVRIISRRSAFFMGRTYLKIYDYGFVFTAAGENACTNFVNFAKRVCKKVAAQSNDENIWVSSPLFKEGQHIIGHFLQLAQDCGIKNNGSHLSYAVSEVERAWAKAFLMDLLPQKYLLVGLQLSSFGTRSYRDWPLKSYKELCSRLLSIYTNIHFVVIGTDHDKPKANHLSETSRSNIHDCTGISMRPTAAIMAMLNLYIGPNTGPSWVMSTLGKPMIVLNHCLHPVVELGLAENQHMVVIDMPRLSVCNKSRSMTEIPVDIVFNHACNLLDIPKASI